jgi:hypothetical protein
VGTRSEDHGAVKVPRVGACEGEAPPAPRFPGTRAILVAEMSSRSEGSPPQGATGPWEARLRLAALVAAVLVALSLLTRGWRDGRPRFERAGRGEGEGALVRLDRDGHLELLAVLEDGGLVRVERPGGAALAGGVDLSLAGLPAALASPVSGEPREVRWWLLLAGRTPLSPELLEPYLALRAGFPAELDHLGLRLEDELGVRVARVRAGG